MKWRKNKMSKKKVYYTKELKIEYFCCGEKVCFEDCEICNILHTGINPKIS